MRATKIAQALAILAAYGQRGTSSGDFGAELWPVRTSKATSMGGGGDYAAQMLLGRLRKAGYARRQHSPGSTVWEIAPAGVRELARLRKALP